MRDTIENDDAFQRIDCSSFNGSRVHQGGASYSWCRSFKKVVIASVPTILTNIFFYAVNIINIYFMGHQQDPDLMAGVGLGGMLLNVCFFAVGQGLNGTIETFVS